MIDPKAFLEEHANTEVTLWLYPRVLVGQSIWVPSEIHGSLESAVRSAINHEENSISDLLLHIPEGDRKLNPAVQVELVNEIKVRDSQQTIS